MKDTTRLGFLTSGAASAGALLLAACSGNAVSPSASTAGPNVKRVGNNIYLSSDSGRVLLTVALTKKGATFSTPRGPISHISIADTIRHSSLTLEDGTRLVSTGNGGVRATNAAGNVVAETAIDGANRFTLSLPSQAFTQTQTLPVRTGTGMKPQSCQSAKLAFASCVAAEIVAAATVETGIGVLALAAAAIATASAGEEMQEQCNE